MPCFHVLFQMATSLNSIIDDIFQNLPSLDCQVSELVEFYDTDFCVVPNESLWLAWDTTIRSHKSVSLLVFDYTVYQAVLDHFATDTWEDREELVLFADQNGSVALSIWVSLCGSSQYRVLNASLEKSQEEVSKLKSKVNQLEMKIDRLEDSIRSVQQRQRRHRSRSNSTWFERSSGLLKKSWRETCRLPSLPLWSFRIISHSHHLEPIHCIATDPEASIHEEAHNATCQRFKPKRAREKG